MILNDGWLTKTNVRQPMNSRCISTQACDHSIRTIIVLFFLRKRAPPPSPFLLGSKLDPSRTAASSDLAPLKDKSSPHNARGTTKSGESLRVKMRYRPRMSPAVSTCDEKNLLCLEREASPCCCCTCNREAFCQRRPNIFARLLPTAGGICYPRCDCCCFRLMAISSRKVPSTIHLELSQTRPKRKRRQIQPNHVKNCVQ